MGTSVDLSSFIDSNAQILVVVFYVILFGIPIFRWIVVRYTAKLVSLTQTYLDSISAKISEAKARSLNVRTVPPNKLRPKVTNV